MANYSASFLLPRT